MWNQHEHLEVYFGAPAAGFVTHTLNPRLHPDENAFIATHADDRVLVVDKTLWPVAEPFIARAPFAHVVAVGPGETPPGALEYEALIAEADEARVRRARPRRAAGGDDVLHERDDGQAEGCPLLPSLDRDPRADADRLPAPDPGRRRAPGRADVPRERVVLPVRERPVRGRAGASRARTSTRRACSSCSRPSASRSRRASRRSGSGSSRRSTRRPTRGTSRGCARWWSAAPRRRSR